jgi:hypothetical protein
MSFTSEIHARAVACLTLLSLSISQGQSPPEARFPIQHNGKYGYINQTGAVMIPATLHTGLEFGENIAIVMPAPNTGEIMDASGKILGQLPQCKYVGPFSEGVAAIMQDERRWGYINTSGEIVIPLNFSAAASFSEGLAAVADQSGKWGWIDRTGKFVIAPQFGGGGEFKEDIARFGRGNKSGYLDKTGKIIVEATYFTAQHFSDGLGLVWDGTKKRFLNKTGKTVIELPGNASAQPFSEGLAAVKIGTDVGFLDKTGKMVLKVRFDLASSFSEGLAPVRAGSKENGKWGCIDKTGKVVIPPRFPSKPEFKNGLAKIKTAEGVGYIDRSGKWVWKPSK